jgi:hypothetical protein
MTPRVLPRQMTIAQEGLRHYLDRTKDKHNGLGYSNFIGLLQSGVNKANLARAFTVNPRTLQKWLEIYSQEDGKV